MKITVSILILLAIATSINCTRKPIVVGNWKMNPKTLADAESLLKTFSAEFPANQEQMDIVIAPMALHMKLAKDAAGGMERFTLAAQNSEAFEAGAYTGEQSPQQLKDFGVDWVILGHSERRTKYHEDNDKIAAKVQNALKAERKVIFCIGETLAERESGTWGDVLEAQMKAMLEQNSLGTLKDLVIAYEPVWAIGTGRVATAKQIQEVHAFVRGWWNDNVDKDDAASRRIIYGGSSTPENCYELMSLPDVDGFMVGGASLKPTFVSLVSQSTAAAQAKAARQLW